MVASSLLLGLYALGVRSWGVVLLCLGVVVTAVWLAPFLPRFKSTPLQLMILTAAIAYVCMVFLPDRGFFARMYYREFHAVERRLRSVPGLQFTSAWQHHDITLEDCGCDIEKGNVELRIEFWDRQDWVELFHRVDGIFLREGNNRYDISRDKLSDLGLKITGLTDVLVKLDEVLAACKAHGGPAAFDNYDIRAKNWISLTLQSKMPMR